MYRFFTVLVVFITTNLSLAQTPVAYWPFDGSTGETITKEVQSGADFNILNLFSRPERISGVAGNALRLDGYTTNAEADFSIPSVSNQMTIEAWYTTEAFSASTDDNRQPVKDAAIISQQDDNNGLAIEIGPYGEVYFLFHADGTKYRLQSSSLLEKYVWNHIVGTIDLASNTATLYINGQLSMTQNLATHTAITFSSTKLYLGRSSYSDFAFGISVTHANGALDEIKIYDQVLDAANVLANYNEYASAIPDLKIDPAIRHAGDIYRPQYHAMPATVWTNEPYGLTYYNGKYHLFFQKNPNGPILHFMHWGHVSSPDLVNWQEEKVVFGPDKTPGFDDFGAWSGTTIFDNTGVPQILYTGVNTARAAIGLASPDDQELINWTKSIDNPVIPQAPNGTLDFRDPYVWKYNGEYYMIVGSGFSTGAGGYLPTYKSTDLINWTETTTLYSKTNSVSTTGFFWEMPFFQKLNDKNEYVLGVVPVYNTGRQADAIYWIGKWDGGRFEPYFDEPKYLEFTQQNMLSAAVGLDEAERIAYMGIIAESRPVEKQREAGWTQIFSLPRVMRLLEDSTLGHYPHPNLCRFRENEVVVANRIINTNSGSNNLPEFSGSQSEFKFKVLAAEDSKFSLQFLKSESGNQLSRIDFDLKFNEIVFDIRNASNSDQVTSHGQRYSKTPYVFDHEEPIYVDVFIDHSVIEVFIDNLLVVSGRIYPAETSTRVDAVALEGSIEILEAKQWDMRGFGEDATPSVCEPEYLPTAFRKSVDDPDPPTSIDEKKKVDLIKIYPNPALNKINVILKQRPEAARLSLLSSSGQILRSRTITTLENQLDVTGMQSGIYIIRVSGKEYTINHKILIE
jgi:sucrose-6-phosphate hydrolase SacC (GH32 family)